MENWTKFAEMIHKDNNFKTEDLLPEAADLFSIQFQKLWDKVN